MAGPFVAQQGSLAIVIAAALAVLGFAIASRILSQARASEGTTRLAWILFTGLVAGGTTWAVYFTSLAGLSFGTVAVYDAISILKLLGLIVVGTTLAALPGVVPVRPVVAFAGMLLCFAATLALLAWYGPSLVTVAGDLARPQVGAGVFATATAALCSTGLAIVIWRHASGLARAIGPALALGFAVLLAYAASVYGLEVQSSPGGYFVAAQSDVTRTVFVFGLTAFILVFDLAALAAVLVNSKDRADQLLRTRELVDAAVEGIVIVRNGKIASVNRPMLEFTGRSETEMIGSRLEMHLSSGNQAVDFCALPAGQSVQARLSRLAGAPLAVEVIVNALGHKDGAERVLAVRDISERLTAEKTIRDLAHHDGLTGLPNRVLLNERLEHAITRVKRGEMVAAHLLDLDQFKNVNDTLGHPAGDMLLKEVADRLRTVVRETDTIARMGGDEFAVLQFAISEPADATTLAQRIIEVVSEPYTIDGHKVVIGTSVGIAVGPADGVSPDQLMRNADLALYRAKGKGRGMYRFFEPEMDAEMQARRTMEHDLREALAAGEFELYYQPVVNLASNEITGLEALLRWHHPENGMVSPDAFMPLAEAIGFIVPLGQWVLRNACATAAKWPDHITVSVNISPVQFRNPGLVQIVVGALAASGLPAERLELEITETSLLDDSETTLGVLFRLRELGVRIAMDDFGTGYSSLSYLQSFPFDKIKIDRSFIKDIADAVGSVNIVRAVAALAHGLGIATTAEGVETQEQLDTVKTEGCTEMQGFLFSKPLPAHEIELLLLSKRKERTDQDAADAA
jgi:diguanylate cyclase (GGDEF)-like protein/PAS domain S-box-containing protein